MGNTERIKVVRHTDVDDLDRLAGSFLMEREAEHNLILGICADLREGHYDADEAYLASLREGDAVVGVAVRTPPHNLVISCLDRPGAAEVLSEDVHDACDTLPGVLGPQSESRQFAASWHRRKGAPVAPGMAMRIHVADRITPPHDVPGRMRDATRDDARLITGWAVAFQREALDTEGDRDRAHAWMERTLASSSSGLVIWEDGRPVSMAGYLGPTPNGVRISWVYTPPPDRGHGYASACVAHLSQRLLDSGRRFCFLFTDLANPTSNAVYHRIGYRPVIDVDEHRFGVDGDEPR